MATNKQKEQIKAWQEKHVEVIKLYRAKYYQDKKEFLNKYQAMWKRRKRILEMIKELEAVELANGVV